MGRAFRVVKRSAHLTVEVAERPASPRTPARARKGSGTAGKAPAAKQ
jgi:hypothetical protein